MYTETRRDRAVAKSGSMGMQPIESALLQGGHTNRGLAVENGHNASDDEAPQERKEEEEDEQHL